MFSDILSLGPTSLISEYDGGKNFLYLGTLCKEIRGAWPLPTSTALNCVITSTERLAELPPGPFRTKCFVRGLVHAVDTRQWDQVEWIVPRLPAEYALYSDKLTCAILERGVVSAIMYAISITETRGARTNFRVAAADAVRRGHIDAAKYLCTRFTDSRLRQNVTVVAALEANTDLVKWCGTNIHACFPTEATRAVAYRGNVEVLEWLKVNHGESLTSDQLVLYACLGGSLRAVDWLLNEVGGARFSEEEVCLMVCAKGLLHVLKHVVLERGFRFNRQDCIRFAKKGSGVGVWLSETHT